MSRSWVVPQSHVQVRTLSGILSCKVPQVEHNFEDGNHRSTVITSRPYQVALYSSMLRNSDHAASLMARASFLFLTMLRTVRSSITSVWFSRTRRVVILWRWSRRRSAIRAWILATFLRALARLAPSPVAFLAKRR